jgi:hypothetical protein
MCKLFLSKYATNRVKIAFESIIKILSERPEELIQIKKIINKTEKSFKLQSEITNSSEVYTALHISESTDHDEIPESVENQVADKENNEQKRTIKESSPFTQVFNDIYNKCLIDISSENEHGTMSTNKYYFPSFIEKILDEQLPYCFLWARFAFQDLDLSRKRHGRKLSQVSQRKTRVE